MAFSVYVVTTLRLTRAQKRQLEEAKRLLEARTGRSISQGETVEMLSRFALDKRAMLVESIEEDEETWEGDPLFDHRLTFAAGRTNEKTIDRLLYGRK
ncbi:MAG TPA: hypothetical protein VGB42_00335 [Candidatus Thermoplasmatota archaeon]